ncbi:MAG: TAXI family TRAP transporter solute-binding subunit [Pseudomonadota bacterium]
MPGWWTLRRLLGRVASAGFALTIVAHAAPTRAQDEGPRQSYDQFVREANQNTVTIVAGGPADTSLFIANDLATVLHCVNGLRVIPMVGRGGANNVYDLLFLRGVDLTIVRADVLDRIAQDERYTRNLRERIVYVAPLFSEEVHLIVSDEVETLADLEGKFVNVGPPGSLALAADSLLSQAGVEVIESKFDTSLAIERLIDGRLDAVFLTGGKPIPALAQLQGSTGLKLLSLSPPGGDTVYAAASFSHEDYPDLVRAGEEVATIAVPSVLAGYDWPADHPRYAKTKLFTETLFERIAYLRRPARHQKWSDAQIAGEVTGWRRFAPAEPLVAALQAPAVETVSIATQQASVAPVINAGPSDTEIETMFEQRLAEYGIKPRNDDERALLLDAFKRRLQATAQ